MSFRLKVLFLNMILVAAAFSVSGYLLMERNHKNSLEREIAGSMSENQLILASVESDLVNRILRNSFMGRSEDWMEVGFAIMDALQGTNAWFQISNGETVLFQENSENRVIQADMSRLLSGLEVGQKQYLVYQDEAQYLLASAGSMRIGDSQYYVVNQRDISSVFQEQELQIQYYRYMMIAVLAVCGVLMYWFAGVLTRPIAKLKASTGRIADGNYRVRARIRTRDEIGDLARDFNQMAVAVQHHVKALEEENRRRDEFVANFTHELKTPLTSVIGYAEMLSSQDLEEEERLKAARYIFNEGLRLEAMSMKLFDLLLLNHENIAQQPIFLPELMEAVKESTDPMLERADMELVIEAVPLWIRGDGTLLKTVCINMIDNARKASPAGSRIYYRSLEQGQEAVLEITDFGYGIPNEDQDKITEAFYMVDKSRSREEGGAGLGLSLAARILDRHGARLEIESEEGTGTTMRIRFARLVGMEKEADSEELE